MLFRSRLTLTKEQIPQVIKTIRPNGRSRPQQMVKGLDTTGRSRELRIVPVNSRRIMNSESDRTKAVLMPQPHQVRQFVCCDFCRQQHKVLTGCIRFGSPDLFVTKTGLVALVSVGISTFTTSVDVALSVPLSAVICSTYCPAAENFAVVTVAFGSSNVTVPGPDTFEIGRAHV